MSEELSTEVSRLRARISELDAKLEEFLASGPVAPGIVEAAAALAHDATEFELRVSERMGKHREPED